MTEHEHPEPEPTPEVEHPEPEPFVGIEFDPVQRDRMMTGRVDPLGR